MEAVRLFPYQHKADVDTVLSTMEGWNKNEWKALFRLLDDDSLKANAADVLSAVGRGQLAELIKKYGGVAKSQYARDFIKSRQDLLADKATVDKQKCGVAQFVRV